MVLVGEDVDPVAHAGTLSIDRIDWYRKSRRLRCEIAEKSVVKEGDSSLRSE